MDRNSFNWGTGKVVHWNADAINVLYPLDSQVDELQEDLVQVQYPDSITLDVGWYPEFDPKGKFIVAVVRNQEWDSPLAQITCNTVRDLIVSIEECVKLAESA